MPARNRNHPDALELSFSLQDAQPEVPRSYTQGARKRKQEPEPAIDLTDNINDPFTSSRTVNSDIPRHRLDLSAQTETSGLVVPGESPGAGDNETKPIRMLDNFSFYDPKREHELIPLSVLEDADGIDHHCEGQGVTCAVMEEEDAGQEDDFGESAILLTLSSILACTVDCTRRNAPFYVETQYAFYQLGIPSEKYLPFYRHFYLTRRVAQILISTLTENKEATLGDMLDECNYIDQSILERILEPKDFLDGFSVIKDEVSQLKSSSLRRSLESNPVFKSLSEGNVTHVARSRRKRLNPYMKLGLNLDQAVLEPGNQNQTIITPLIDKLSSGLFQDLPYVVGYKANEKSSIEIEEEKAHVGKKEEMDLLIQLMRKFELAPRWVSKPHVRDNIRDASKYLAQVEIGGEIFKVGDVVILPMDGLKPRLPEIISKDVLTGIIADYFWFARIILIKKDTQKAHVQWFEHSSKTLLEDISNPRELFLTPLCDDYPLSEILGKLSVLDVRNARPEIRTNAFYFYKFQYVDGKFINIPDSSATDRNLPPNNCPACPVIAQLDVDSYPQRISNGYAYHGQSYHLHDFVHFKAEKGPCAVGQIVEFEHESTRRSKPMIAVNLLGRVDTIQHNRPRDCIKDERHLYLTEDVDKIEVADIIRKIFVITPDMVSDLETWKSMSPAHFYVRYKFASVKTTSWRNNYKSLEPADIAHCKQCFGDNRQQVLELNDYIHKLERSPLKAMDLFAGVGAFGMGMEKSCPIRVTHAVEISPSAAQTIKHNSPGTIVYNQCSNEMLRYAVDISNKVKDDVPKSIEGDKLDLPPKQGDIDIIIAGFPCQPHSSLNMYQRANDRKSHLILNLLSWVDFMRPRFCFFENVRGFLTYNLNAVQKNKHQREGGIHMGGLKFVVRALVAMDYQVKFALLQAGHYGAPQTRVRFFLFAAKRGEIIPDFPQPTHDFPVTDALKIKVRGKDVQPIQTLTGTAPAPFVTIQDAIGDLPLFDWKGTKRASLPSQAQELDRNVPVLEVDRSKGRCGYEGPNSFYRSEPATSFQAWCRKEDTKDLQHFTRTLLEDVVNRVIHIPLRPRADYRELPRKLWEYQISNQRSAVARGGFKAGFYGRLGKDEHFFTTVTNVEPTAKQCWVLHPECKRVITVRELARSQGFPDNFVFHSILGDVKTMHRQIGNAVAWPVSIAIGRELTAALYKGHLGKGDHDLDDNMEIDEQEPEYIEISSD